MLRLSIYLKECIVMAEPNMAEEKKMPEATTNQPGEQPAMGPADSSKKGLWLLVGLVAVVAVGGLVWWLLKPAAAPKETKTLKMGLMTAGFSGGGIEDSVKLAQKEVTVDGYKIEIISKITDCDATKTAAAMDELVKAGVVAVIGEQCSGATLAAAPAANTNKIPLISPASSSPKLTTDGGDYVFRTIPSDALASDFTGKYLYNDAKLRKLAIVYGDEAYGTGLKDGIKSAFEKLGGTVVRTEAIPDDNPVVAKIAAQVAAIKAASPDAVYVASSFAASNTALAVELQKAGLTKVYGGETFSDTAFIKDAGAAAEGIMVINISQGTPSFVEKSQAAWGVDPQVYAAQAYDAYTALMKALAKGNDTGEGLQKGLTTVDFEGVSGHIKFDASGDVAGNYSLFTIKDGKIKAAN
jgi:branched-chain amino acid transport system substrate-binding protein